MKAIIAFLFLLVSVPAQAQVAVQTGSQSSKAWIITNDLPARPVFSGANPQPSARAPIAVSDFKNGVYTLNGKLVAYEDLWGKDVGLGHVVPGVGWTYSTMVGGIESYIPATKALNKAIGVPSGFAVVMDCSIDTPDLEGSRSIAVAAAVWNDPTDDYSALAGAFHDPPSSGGSGGTPPWMSTTDGSAYQYITLGEIHRLAADLGPTDEYISVDGGPVQHAKARWSSTLNAFYLYSVVERSGFGPQKVVVERIAIYPRVDTLMLPMLSLTPRPLALGNPMKTAQPVTRRRNVLLQRAQRR